MQVYRGFVRTLKWWSVSSQTDSGDSAGPLWLQPFWRYIFALLFISFPCWYMEKHARACSWKWAHYHCCQLSCPFWRNGSCCTKTLYISFLHPVLPPDCKFESWVPLTNSTDTWTCISWADFLRNGHLFVPWSVGKFVNSSAQSLQARQWPAITNCNGSHCSCKAGLTMTNGAAFGRAGLLLQWHHISSGSSLMHNRRLIYFCLPSFTLFSFFFLLILICLCQFVCCFRLYPAPASHRAEKEGHHLKRACWSRHRLSLMWPWAS